MRAEFETFTLDLDQRALTREGTPIHITPKVLALLEILLRNAPNAVAKEVIYQQVWGESFVEEANIPNLVSDLRSALGENPSRRLIQTVHKFGYRFVSEVRWSGGGRPPVSAAHCCLVWGSREYGIADGTNVVGRDLRAAVAIDSAGVSRRHARIVVDGVSALIEDLGSKNGTFVNGRKLEGIANLNDGDTILLGTVSLTFHQIATRDTTVTRSPGG